VLTSTALVLFMTLPGLALFYAGLVRQKNVLSVMMQCVAITCVVSILWLAFAYSLAFEAGNAIIGGLSKSFLANVTRSSASGAVPEVAFFMFQMTFAIITPALIIGAFAERVKFSAVLLFTVLWLLIVYAPVAHWVWGGGWAQQRGVMDFAGGIVVHATAGVSALLFAREIGPRDGFPGELHPPHNPGMTMIGAGMLWVGWYGFNGGSALAADGNAAMAITVTHISASAAGIVWAGIEWARFKRPSLMGAVTGVVAGLATITPASGYVGPGGALVLGCLAGSVCFFAVQIVKQKMKVDDSLDVFAVHGVGGIMGSILVALFASENLGGYPVTGSLGAQFGAQLFGVGAAVIWTAVATMGILLVTKALVGLRASEQFVQDGLDLAEHGERATPT
jgi:Amt family ammonium transporter